MVRPLFCHCFFQYFHQTPILGLADRPALGNFHEVTQTRQIARIVYAQLRATANILAVTRVLDFIINLTGHALVAAAADDRRLARFKFFCFHAQDAFTFGLHS